MTYYAFMVKYLDRKRQYIDMGFPVHLAAERAHGDVNKVEPRS